MNPEQEERRGEDARQVLENSIYKEAYAQIEANIVAKMAQQATTAAEGEDLRRLLIALRKVRTYIEQVAVTGKMAAIEADRKRGLVEQMTERYLRRA